MPGACARPGRGTRPNAAAYSSAARLPAAHSRTDATTRADARSGDASTHTGAANAAATQFFASSVSSADIGRRRLG